MIKRLGIVIWWLGAITFGIACFSMATSMSKASECEQLRAQLALVNAKIQTILDHAPPIKAVDASEPAQAEKINTPSLQNAEGGATAKKGAIDWDVVNAELQRKNEASKLWDNDPAFARGAASEPTPDAIAPAAATATQNAAQSEDPILKALSQANAVPPELSEKQQDLSQKSEACSPQMDYSTALLFTFAGIAMWAFSFILSGSFLRPAKLP